MNVHQKKWQKFSSGGNTIEGETLQTTCEELGLKQLVREPTRGSNLLDLVLTDIPDATCQVLPAIADHRVVQTQLSLQVPVSAPTRREVWSFAKADWQGLEKELGELDWLAMGDMDPDTGAEWMTKCILARSEEHIGKRWVTTPKSTHPWLNDRAMIKVGEKITAEGTVNEKQAAQDCNPELALKSS